MVALMQCTKFATRPSPLFDVQPCWNDPSAQSLWMAVAQCNGGRSQIRASTDQPSRPHGTPLVDWKLGSKCSVISAYVLGVVPAVLRRLRFPAAAEDRRGRTLANPGRVYGKVQWQHT